MILTPHDLVVLQRYNEPHRRYHTVFHPLEMLELHETGFTRGISIPSYVKPEWPALQEADFISAVVGHDCVYEIGREKGWNERASYQVWKQTGGYDDSGVVEKMFEATITHEPPADAVEWRAHDFHMVKHLIDLDMSVLGAHRHEFDVNSANIMAEFLYPGKISLDDYTAGRRAFFAKTLAQPRIFFTPQFYEALEYRARANMIQDLGSTWPIPDVWRTGVR